MNLPGKIVIFSSLLVSLLVLGDSPALADSRRTGAIEGIVFDLGETPMASVTVVLRGEAIKGSKRKSVTDRRGEFYFIDLPPGTYELSAVRSGETASQEGINLSLGARKRLSLYLVPDSAETIVIRGKPPVLDTSTATLSETLSRDFFKNLPVNRRGFNQLLLLFAGTTPNPRSSSPGVRGGAWTDNQLVIDGINYSDPISNSLIASVDFYAIEQIELIGGGAEAEYGQGMGSTVNVVTRSGGNSPTLNVRTNLSLAAATSDSDGGEQNTNLQLHVDTGGPIVKDRAWHFESATYTFNYTPFKQIEGQKLAAGRSSHLANGFTKLNYKPSKKDELVLHLAGNYLHNLNTERDVVALAEAQKKAIEGSIIAQLSWKRRYDMTVLKLDLGGYYRDFIVVPQRGDVDSPAIIDLDTGFRSGNARDILHYRPTRLQAQASVSHHLRDAWGNHELKLGAEVSLMSLYFENARPGNETLLTQGGNCVPEELIFDGCYRAVRTGTEAEDGSLIPGIFQAKASGLQGGLYLRDHWYLGKGVSLSPGWRFDFGNIKGLTGKTLASFSGLVGPRMGATWDIGEKATTVLRLSAGRTYQTGFLALPLFFGPSLRTETYEFNPVTGQFDSFIQASGGDTGGTVDRSQSSNTPHSDEAIISLERVLFDRLTARITGTYRRSSNLYDSVEGNLIWNEAGSTVIGFRDGSPKPQYSLNTSDDFFREYAGAEIALRGQIGEDLYLLASYTLSRLYGTNDMDLILSAENVVPFVIANPRQRQFLYGPLQADRRHAAKLVGSYAIRDLGLVLSGVGRAYSGAPYSRLYFNSFLNGYYDRRAPRGIDPGDLNDPNDDRELRTSPFFQVDIFAAMDLGRYFGVEALSLELQAENILNRRTALAVREQNIEGDAGFGSALIRQAPLRLSLALNLEY